MSKIEYYVDGCSYTRGHEKDTPSWPTKIYKFLPTETGLVAPQNAIDNSQIAKSNEHIFFDFLQFKDKLDSDSTVIIFWSHCERYSCYLDLSQEIDHIRDVKNLNSSTIIEGYKHITGNFNLKEGFLYQLYDMYIAKTLMYIYLVQEECERRNIKYFFITQDPFYKFKEVMKLPNFAPWSKLIKQDKIFNWPAPDYEDLNADKTKNFSRFITVWSLTGFVTSWCRAFSRQTGKILFAEDCKHMNRLGQDLFYEQLIRWMNDTSKNLNYIIEHELEYDAARNFKDLNYAAQNFLPFELLEPLKNDTKRFHWVERAAFDYLQNAKMLADYVYEKDK